MDKQQLDDAIGPVPPSTVDVEAIIGTQRRAARVRVVANPWTATVVAVAAIVGGIWVVPGGTAGGDAGPAGQGLAADCPRGEDASAQSEQLYEDLAAALPAGVELDQQQRASGLATPEPGRPHCTVSVHAGISSPSGTGNVSYLVSTGRMPQTCDEVEGGAIESCVADTGPDGKALVVATGDQLDEKTNEPIRNYHRAWVTVPGSEWSVQLVVSSDSLQTEPLLTIDEITDLALSLA